MAQSNDITQPELMSTQSGELDFSVSKADRPILRISPADWIPSSARLRSARSHLKSAH